MAEKLYSSIKNAMNNRGENREIKAMIFSLITFHYIFLFYEEVNNRLTA